MLDILFTSTGSPNRIRWLYFTETWLSTSGMGGSMATEYPVWERNGITVPNSILLNIFGKMPGTRSFATRYMALWMTLKMHCVITLILQIITGIT